MFVAIKSGDSWIVKNSYVFVASFTGPDAEAKAREYANERNRELPSPHPAPAKSRGIDGETRWR